MDSLLHAFQELPFAVWESLGLTLRLAALVTLLLLCIATPLAWWLSVSRSHWVPVVEAVISLPMVLPPTVLGFYLLTLMGPETPLGRAWYRIVGDTLTFSFSGLVVASILYSLPYAVQPIASVFRSVQQNYLDASVNLGAGLWTSFRRVTLPLSRRGFLVAAILAFAHTVGEFGVVVMIGGSIPGRTRVASIALYDEVQKLNYPAAHVLALILLALSFVFLLTMTLLQRRLEREA